VAYDAAMPTAKRPPAERHVVRVLADGESIAELRVLDAGRADGIVESVLRAAEQRTPVRIPLLAVADDIQEEAGTMVFDPAGSTTVVVEHVVESSTGGAMNFKR
jgi:hypothetical protein